MVFAYYAELSRTQQALYRRSAREVRVRVPRPRGLAPQVRALRAALAGGRRVEVESASRALALALTERLGVAPLRLRVRAVRPSADWGELHGLYEAAQGRRRAVITLWMRTAKRRQTVAFRTYLRTLLHEMCHHLDFTLLGYADSLHTEGFYKREASLFHQLVR